MIGWRDRFDGTVDLVGPGDADRLIAARLAGDAPEHEDGLPGANLVAGSQDGRFGDALAVDVGAVGRVQIVDQPPAVVGGQLGVAAGDGHIRQRQGLGGSADLLRLVVGQFETPALVRPV